MDRGARSGPRFESGVGKGNFEFGAGAAESGDRGQSENGRESSQRIL